MDPITITAIVVSAVSGVIGLISGIRLIINKVQHHHTGTQKYTTTITETDTIQKHGKTKIKTKIIEVIPKDKDDSHKIIVDSKGNIKDYDKNESIEMIKTALNLPAKDSRSINKQDRSDSDSSNGSTTEIKFKEIKIEKETTYNNNCNSVHIEASIKFKSNTDDIIELADTSLKLLGEHLDPQH